LPSTKITDATALTALAGDEIPVNRGGVDGKITVEGIVALTNFLDLSDSPNSYTGFGPLGQEQLDDATVKQAGAFVRVNTDADGLEFKYSTTDYLDIRDFGTVVDDGDIGPALQAAFDSVDGNAASAIIRVPGGFRTDYTCSPITFPTNCAIVLELNCRVIDIEDTWSLNSGQSIKGLCHATFNETFPYTTTPRPTIRRSSAVSNFYPTLEIREAQNVWVEGINVQGGALAFQSDLITFKYCALGANSGFSKPGVSIDTCFWVQMDNILASGTATIYAAEFVAEWGGTPGGTLGLVRCRDWVTNSNGILIKSYTGLTDNLRFTDVHSEGQIAGQYLFTLDSTDGTVGDIKIIEPGISDTVGGLVNVIHNIGTTTSNVILANWAAGGANGEPISATSTAMNGFVLDNTGMQRIGAISEGATSPASRFAGYKGAQNFQQRTPSSIDAKLLCAPVGPTWTPFTPLAVAQDPANWTPLGAEVVTSGFTAPDGSTMAATITGGADGATCWSQSMTLAVGDWFIAGVWIRQFNGGSAHGARNQIDAPFGSGIRFNHSELDNAFFASMTDPFWESRTKDNGWLWCCCAFQVTAIGSMPQTINMTLGPSSSRYWFAPCAAYIPAANADDSFITNVARSLKGGWSSSALASDVSVLNHQRLRLGGGAAVFSATTMPTTGTGVRGDICYNKNAAQGQPMGWVCVTAGSPGTWVQLGTIPYNSQAVVTGTGSAAFVGITATGVGQGALSATGTGAAAFVSPASGASALLLSELDGFAIDATTSGGTVTVLDTGTPANNLSNVSLDASNLAQASTSAKVVRWSDGTLQTIAAGSIPQQYDTSLSKFGILVEPEATNLVLRSQQLDNATWTPSQLTITADATAAPDGTTTADMLTHNSVSTDSITQDISVSSGANYTASFYVKRSTLDWVLLTLQEPAGANGVRQWFNINTGVVGSNATFGSGWTSVSHSIEALANGWYRIVATVTTGATSMQVSIATALADAVTTTSASGSAYYVWGVQAELGSAASSYIATTTATVTRAVDDITVDLTTLPFDTATGTFYADYSLLNRTASSNFYNVAGIGLDLDNYITIQGNGSTTLRFIVETSNVQQVAALVTSPLVGVRQQGTIAWTTNDVDTTFDGAAPTNDASATIPTGLVRVNIGTRSFLSVANNPMHGYLYRFVYVPRHVENDDGDLENWRYNF
jgi:hypothetical protein